MPLPARTTPHDTLRYGDVQADVWTQEPLHILQMLWSPRIRAHVDAIVAHAVDEDDPSKIEFCVKWTGYELAPEQPWSPYEHVQNTAVLQDYLRRHPGLERFLPPPVDGSDDDDSEYVMTPRAARR